MKKRITSIILMLTFVFVACFGLSACNNNTEIKNPDKPIPPIPPKENSVLISGDVSNNISITKNYFKKNDFKIEELKDSKKNIHKGYNLKKVIDLVYPLNDFGKVMITAKKNNVAACVNVQSTNKCIIEFVDNKINIVSNELPVTVNIKEVGQIILIQNNYRTCKEILRNKMMVKTCGDLLRSTAKPIGSSVVKNGYELQKSKKPLKEFKLTEVFPENLLNLKSGKITAILKNANQVQLDKLSTLKYENGSLNAYLNDKLVFKNIGTIGVGEIDGNISDTYRDVEKALKKNNKVMVIELDGFSYMQYQLYKTELCYLYDQEKTVTAKYSMFPSISNVGLAGILTGKLPLENKIAKRGDNEVNCKTIFDLAKEQDKSFSYIEGRETLLDLIGVEQISSVDLDKFKTTDKGVLENALKERAKNPDLMYVHFHGVDDVNHKYNAYSTEAREKILQSDNYIKQLTDGFKGTVIIVSDHGHHIAPEVVNGSVIKKGNHGTFCFEDVVTPYIMFEVK